MIQHKKNFDAPEIFKLQYDVADSSPSKAAANINKSRGETTKSSNFTGMMDQVRLTSKAHAGNNINAMSLRGSHNADMAHGGQNDLLRVARELNSSGDVQPPQRLPSRSSLRMSAAAAD